MMCAPIEISDADSILQSKKLVERIKKEIIKNDFMFFDQYMQMALYTPELGYYASATNILGEKGDFTTAPELTTLFAECFANAFIGVLNEIKQPSILEYGAGTGQFALAVLNRLSKKNQLPEYYYILEVNAYLRKRQEETLHIGFPEFFDRVIWLDRLPDENTFSGIIFANEVLDAMPVVRFIKTKNQIKEIGIRLKNDQLYLAQLTPRSEVLSKVLDIEKKVGLFSEGYSSEINLWLGKWMKSVSSILKKGAIFIVDYGYEERDYYRFDRSMGTIQCYFKHKVHDDALFYPGLQDITAHIDFTEVANSALQSELVLEGYTSQAAFLSDCQLEQLYQKQFQQLSSKLQLELASKIKTLLMPGSMGDIFKVIGFSRNLEAPLAGFDLNDLSHRL